MPNIIVDPNLSEVRPVPYRVYIALLSQGGTGNPVATILENTLGFVPVWTRLSEGIYQAVYIGGFPVGKTTFTVSNGVPLGYIINCAYGGTDFVSFESGTLEGVHDDGFNDVVMEIRVYP